VGLLKGDILAQAASMLEDTSDNASVVERIEAGLSSAGATTSDIAFAGDQKTLVGSLLGLLLNGGIRHNMLPYVVAAGAPVTDVASLLAYNAADPAVRIPFGQGVLEGAMKDTTLDKKADFDDAVEQTKPMAAATLDAAFAAGADVLVTVNNYHSAVYSTANYPAVTVPLGLRANGMPVGATFIGKPGEEEKLLAYAFAFEQATKARVDPDLAK
jgi:amidase